MSLSKCDRAVGVESDGSLRNQRQSDAEAKSPTEGLCTPTPQDEQRPVLAASKEDRFTATEEIELPGWASRKICTPDHTTLESRRRGVLFEDLSVHGLGSAVRVQPTVLSTLCYPFIQLFNVLRGKGDDSVQQTILYGFNGVLFPGEMLLVLGRPGSGCSTFLKALCGRYDGLSLDELSKIQYKGISLKKVVAEFRGEVVYNAEADNHFPHLTVGETLSFAAHARTPRNQVGAASRRDYAQSAVNVTMNLFGLSHLYDSKVGDDYVRGVSGGERKRVSIAEMVLSRACFGAWDNSTRGLDAVTALEFVRALRQAADLTGSCHAVAAYQASEPIYNTFDHVIVLYEGREVFFGPSQRAVEYFEEMGWERPARQTSADFLAAVTDPGERQSHVGMEDRVPRHAAEFEAYWKQSPDHAALQALVQRYAREHPLDSTEEARFAGLKHEEQAEHARPSSPYLLSLGLQIRLCLTRAFQRTRNDIASIIATAIVQIVVAVIIGSLFYAIPDNSEGMGQRATVLFLAVLTNALIAMLEINVLFSQRPIVEKQTAFAFVHPFTEALAGIILDLPIKLFRCLLAGVILYFMSGLRREASHFFIYILFQLTAVVTMSGMFRTLASMTRAVGEAMALAGIMIMCIAVYTGFTLPQFDMHPWFAWIRWVNPIFYAYEGIVANEFHDRLFECNDFIPNYLPSVRFNSFTCSSIGSIAGELLVSGDRYIWEGYEYSYKHIWRNFAIMIAFTVFFHVVHLVLTEYAPKSQSAAEVLVFRQGNVPKVSHRDLELGEQQFSGKEGRNLHSKIDPFPKQKDILSWRGLNYEIPVKGGHKRLLEDVNGWVKPGTLTALMGVSGAGKTTLLDVLAQRASVGVITGEVLVNGNALDPSFCRKTAYVPQQDLHLETATVREALQFSAALRRPRSVPTEEKNAFVEDVIQMLGMEEFAEAVIGHPGAGLNGEQRKLLSIGVELAAKPQLLIFLDEPTSGLDAHSSWAICAFMKKLADHGQAVLATIHQPSANLFEQFDRLLLLGKGGRTLYFGDVGHRARTLLDYVEKNGGRRCGLAENPAEYIIEVIGADAHGQTQTIDWVNVWNQSPEHQQVVKELDYLASLASGTSTTANLAHERDEFAMPIWNQCRRVIKRDFQQYYRQPDYIMSKFALGIVCGLFIGFSFWKSDNSRQGFQNTLFSLFLLCTIFSTMVNQIMPKFVTQRSLYELRERPSKAYSWKVFLLSQFLVELPWQILLGICTWASFYFSVYGGNQSPQRQGLVLLFVVEFFIFASSFAQFVVASLPSAALGSMLAVFMFLLSLLFNGIMQPPSALPHFWRFMNHVSPLTYYVSGISATALHDRPIQCSDRELSLFDPPVGQTCGHYLAQFLVTADGQLYNPDSSQDCQYCAYRSADQYLAIRDIAWDDRWRNFGIFWVYIVFNVIGAIVLYYVFRVLPHSRKTRVHIGRS
ncbi:CDR ABC transporter [Penicillium cataractarum]|uniref:CDR ABC transporter n=1 Tax=Penicillium cataractarum TaxID=2100454 RepID=A0A9X0B5Q4_9EURO|nr:CDR ABC transporter [Penicillium cataractarum]KAJ5388987.1 CDR ABC transporter [Penicillium cataractarum]